MSTTRMSGKLIKPVVEWKPVPPGTKVKRGPIQQATDKIFKQRGYSLSGDFFVANAIEYLQKAWGDIHMEWMKGDRWAVSSCQNDTKELGSTLALALARAVLKVSDVATR